MSTDIRVSRHGLTTCPSCKSHIKAAESLAATECPFCRASVMDPAGRARLPVRGRSRALLAATLLGTALVVTGCPVGPAPAYGSPPAEQPQEQGPADAAPGPAYGQPAPDSTNKPLYGGPPTPDGSP